MERSLLCQRLWHQLRGFLVTPENLGYRRPCLVYCVFVLQILKMKLKIRQKVIVMIIISFVTSGNCTPSSWYNSLLGQTLLSESCLRSYFILIIQLVHAAVMCCSDNSFSHFSNGIHLLTFVATEFWQLTESCTKQQLNSKHISSFRLSSEQITKPNFARKYIM